MSACSQRTAAIGLLGAILAVGVCAMYGVIDRNGYMASLRDCYQNMHEDDHCYGPSLRPHGEPIIPFTGIAAVDTVLTYADDVWAPVRDGSHAALSVYMCQFAGQLVPAFATMLVEERRHDAAGGRLAVQAVVWGMLMQCAGYGVSMSLFCLVHILRSPPMPRDDVQALAAAIRIADEQTPAVAVLPAALGIGYVLLSAATVVPQPGSGLHQWLGFLWQFFPVCVVLCQRLLLWGTTETGEERSLDTTGARALTSVYNFSTYLCCTTQLVALVYIGLGVSDMSFRAVFVPPPFWAPGRAADLGDGFHAFLQYDQYVGSAAALVWGLYLHEQVPRPGPSARTCTYYGGLLLCMACWTAAAGPWGAIGWLLLDRDRMVSVCADKPDLEPRPFFSNNGA